MSLRATSTQKHLEEINNFGTTILITTHDEQIVNQLRKRVITIRNGKMIGDQKNDGHYDLDAVRTRIVKRPLAATRRVAPTAEEIRRATNSRPVPTAQEHTRTTRQTNAAMPRRKFIQ